MNWPRLWLATLLGIALWLGFGVTSLALLSVFGPGSGLIKVMLAAVLSGCIAIVGVRWTWNLFGRISAAQNNGERLDRAERAIWRLGYRRRKPLLLEDIVRETFLDEATALMALDHLIAKGEVRYLNPQYLLLFDRH